jgi:hypothetical protein
MMDSRNELRAALEGERAKVDAATARQRALDDERSAYEQKETAAIARLQDLAALTLEGLNQEAPAQPVPLNPKAGRLSRTLGARTVVGWEIDLECYQSRLDRHILCPDKRLLIRPEEKRHGKMPPLPYTTLRGWVQGKLHEGREPVESAFRYDPVMDSGLIKYSGCPREKLLRR